jgi:hypothetical protein
MKKACFFLLVTLFCFSAAYAQKPTKEQIDSFIAQYTIATIEVVPVLGHVGLKGRVLPYRFELDESINRTKLTLGDTVQVRYDIDREKPGSGDWVLSYIDSSGIVRTDAEDLYEREYYKGVVRTVRHLTEKEKKHIRKQMLKEGK